MFWSQNITINSSTKRFIWQNYTGTKHRWYAQLSMRSRFKYKFITTSVTRGRLVSHNTRSVSLPLPSCNTEYDWSKCRPSLLNCPVDQWKHMTLPSPFPLMEITPDATPEHETCREKKILPIHQHIINIVNNILTIVFNMILLVDKSTYADAPGPAASQFNINVWLIDHQSTLTQTIIDSSCVYNFDYRHRKFGRCDGRLAFLESTSTTSMLGRNEFTNLF